MKWRGVLARLLKRLDRHPWLLPLLSFAGGAASFFMVRRGEQLARPVAALVLLGWSPGCCGASPRAGRPMRCRW
jgi:hypothetical protein